MEQKPNKPKNGIYEEHYEGTERCRVNKPDTEGDCKKTKSGGDEIQGGPIRGSFTNQH